MASLESFLFPAKTIYEAIGRLSLSHVSLSHVVWLLWQSGSAPCGVEIRGGEEEWESKSHNGKAHNITVAFFYSL